MKESLLYDLAECDYSYQLLVEIFEIVLESAQAKLNYVDKVWV